MKLMIPKELYTKLLAKANAANMSLARYIITILKQHIEG